MIVMGEDAEELKEVFESVQLAAVSKCQHCMPYENNLPHLYLPALQETAQNALAAHEGIRVVFREQFTLTNVNPAMEIQTVCRSVAPRRGLIPSHLHPGFPHPWRGSVTRGYEAVVPPGLQPG